MTPARTGEVDLDAAPDPTTLPIFTGRGTAGQPPARRRSPIEMRLATAPPTPISVPAQTATVVDLRASTTRPHPRSRRAGDTDGIDWKLVAALRSQASDQLASAMGERAGLDREAQEELGRSIIHDLLQAASSADLAEGRGTWSLTEQDSLAVAVFDALFGLGRLQPLVDDDHLETIVVYGTTTLLEDTDGLLTPGPPVADTDEELIDFLVFLGSRSEVNARPFSPAHPNLHLRLDGGARLAAAAWVTQRPRVTIRRHRLRQVTLDDLVARHTLTPVMASFLRAAVQARLSVVVSGPQNGGKTTMLRALCSALDPWEIIGTFETEYELHLHELPEQHLPGVVHAVEARPGSGERGPDGRQAGEYTLDEAIYDSFRHHLSRQIVGEVRGREVWAMIKAMESGAGSMSTTHGRDAEAGIRKLVTCAMEAGPHVTQELATSKLAESIDLIVQMHVQTTPLGDGRFRRTRWVDEVLAITPGEQVKGYAVTQVFAPAPDGGPAQPGTLPDHLRALEAHGFDLGGFIAQAESTGYHPRGTS